MTSLRRPPPGTANRTPGVPPVVARAGREAPSACSCPSSSTPIPDRVVSSAESPPPEPETELPDPDTEPGLPELPLRPEVVERVGVFVPRPEVWATGAGLVALVVVVGAGVVVVVGTGGVGAADLALVVALLGVVVGAGVGVVVGTVVVADGALKLVAAAVVPGTGLIVVARGVVVTAAAGLEGAERGLLGAGGGAAIAGAPVIGISVDPAAGVGAEPTGLKAPPGLGAGAASSRGSDPDDVDGVGAGLVVPVGSPPSLSVLVGPAGLSGSGMVPPA